MLGSGRKEWLVWGVGTLGKWGIFRENSISFCGKCKFISWESSRINNNGKCFEIMKITDDYERINKELDINLH